MKVLKPLHLSLLTRPYEFERRFHLGISVLAFAPMGDEPSLLSDISMWKFAGEEMGDGGILDAGIPKTTCEFLVAGKACPPGGAAPGCTVRAQVAGVDKSLMVLGDRVWAGSHFTDPIPYQEMPITWDKAYGGAGHPSNPAGKGRGPVVIGEQSFHPLPNIESPKSPISSKRHKPDPAGFGALDVTTPSRAKRAGQYKKKWLKDEYPGMASNIDWRFFNMAPDDQHLPTPYRPGDIYRFQHMHPSEPFVEGRIPDLKTRVFLTRDKPVRSDRMEEIVTQLTTVWFFPHAKKKILVFHGRADLREEDAADVSSIMIAAETSSSQRSPAHYAAVHAKRMDKASASLEALNHKDLVSEELAAPDPTLEQASTELTSENRMAKNAHKKRRREVIATRQKAEAEGLDPDQIAGPVPPEEIEPPPSLEEIPEILREQEEKKQQAEEELEKVIAENEQRIREQAEGSDLDVEQILAEMKKKPAGPPVMRAAAQRAQWQQAIAEAQARDEEEQIAFLIAMMADKETMDLLDKADESARENYRSTVQHQDPAPPLEEAAAAAHRQRITDHLANSRDLSNADLTGADLSNLDLRGVNFEGAFCESANFTSTSLEGANFQSAVLARANLTRAKIGGANFEKANLSGASLPRTPLQQPLRLGQAILEESDLSGVSFRGSDMRMISLRGSTLRGADLSGVQATQVFFQEIDLGEACFDGAKLGQAVFVKCKVDGMQARQADICRASFVTCIGAVQLDQAKMDQAVFVEGCDLSGSRFVGAQYQKGCMRECTLTGANFAGATLGNCDLSLAELQGSQFTGATARACLFLKSNLQRANLQGADLRESIFLNAQVQEADFSRSNLYMADLARIRASEGTRFDQAYFERVRTMPKYEPPGRRT